MAAATAQKALTGTLKLNQKDKYWFYLDDRDGVLFWLSKETVKKKKKKKVVGIRRNWILG